MTGFGLHWDITSFIQTPPPIPTSHGLMESRFLQPSLLIILLKILLSASLKIENFFQQSQSQKLPSIWVGWGAQGGWGHSGFQVMKMFKGFFWV